MSRYEVFISVVLSKTIRITGRPLRAIEEHMRLIELLGNRESAAAEELMATIF